MNVNEHHIRLVIRAEVFELGGQRNTYAEEMGLMPPMMLDLVFDKEKPSEVWLKIREAIASMCEQKGGST